MHETDTKMPAGGGAGQVTALCYEPLIYEAAGAATTAVILLRLLEAGSPLADDRATQPAMDWVAHRLASATENLIAFHEKRAPRWRTLMDFEEIAAALAMAEAGQPRRAAGVPAHG